MTEDEEMMEAIRLSMAQNSEAGGSDVKPMSAPELPSTEVAGVSGDAFDANAIHHEETAAPAIHSKANESVHYLLSTISYPFRSQDMLVQTQ